MAGPTVNAQHRVYQKLLPRWTMIRDAVEGESQVKAKGPKYLPKLHKQEQAQYDAYRMRALFFEASRRTLQGLVGMVMRKDPVITAKDTVKEGFLKNLTKNNLSLTGFSTVVMQEVLMMNKYGILADLPPVISNTAEPWLVGYNAESMINWEYDIDAEGKKILTRMVLEEEYEEAKEGDRFTVEAKKQWRVLELVSKEMALLDLEAMDNPPEILFDPTQVNVYRVQMWRMKKDLEGPAGAAAKADEFVLHDQFFPTLRGAAMETIPFVVVTSVEEDEDEQKPPMEGLASVNMSHYRTSADLEHGRHFTALPTPYVAGLTEQQELVIGSEVAWVITGVTGQEVSIGMLEFTGQGLKALETAIAEKQQQMAILGARLLESQKAAAEAFETHELRAAGEHSVLAQVANGVSDGLNEALALMSEWDGTLGEMSAELNTEFVRVGMSPQMIQQLLLALQAGRISFKTWFFNMQQGGMFPDEHTEEDEMALIETDLANMDQGIDDMDDDDETPAEDDDDEEEEEDEE